MTHADPQVRVKVYRMEDGTQWTDKGTGYCTLEDYQGVLHLNVVSESELNRLILDCIVQRGEVYQQQDEPTGEDLALSFQEQAGCQSILSQISEFENAVKENALSPGSPAADEVSLPLPTMGSLAEIEHTIGEAGRSLYRRDKLVALIMKGEFLDRLRELHETCEDLEATEELHTIYRIARHIILLNDSSILECISRDENIIGVVGMLEYDPQRTVEPGTHRRFLRDGTRFKEVVPIRDADIQAKIHQTFRLQYLKDVVLPPIADEGTLPVINTLIFFNHVQISNYVHSNAAFASELVGIIQREGESEKKHDAVMLLRQLCSMSKCLPAAYRVSLYRALGRSSLIPLLEYALQARDRSLRPAGLEMLMAVLEQDRGLVRSHVLEQRRERRSGPSLLALVVEGTQCDIGSEAQATYCEALRVMLDTLAPLVDPMGIPAALASGYAAERDASDFLDLFYEDHAPAMVAPLALTTQEEARRMGASSSRAELLLFLCDLLVSMVRYHGQRARALLLSSNAIDGVRTLLGARLVHLRLAALRVIKACVCQHDDAFGRYLIAHGVFGTAVELLASMLPRDNLVSSACRELLVLVANHGQLALLAHILGAYSKPLEKSPDTLEILRHAYAARTEKADDARGGGMATPTVDAGRRGVVSVNMLVGHDSRPPAVLGGLAHGGPWGSAMTDEIEDAYLESFDEDSGRGSPGGIAEPVPADGEPWALEPRSPELDSLQECLGVLAAGKSASAALGGEPPPPPKLQGARVDTDEPGAAPGSQPLPGGGMSVATAFPDSRPVGRRLGRRGLGGRLGSASQIKISMSLSPSRCVDSDGPARPVLTKRRRTADGAPADVGHTVDSGPQPQPRETGSPEPVSGPEPARRSSSLPCAHDTGSHHAATGSSVDHCSPPKKARTASSC